MIGLVYDRANKAAYAALQNVSAAQSGQDVAAALTNKIFPSILNKVSETIMRGDRTDRKYDRFKIPLDRFGAITQYLMSNMIRPDDALDLNQGDVVNDFVVNNPDILARYVTKHIKANYGMTINSDEWENALEAGDNRGMASMLAVAFQALYDGIAHDHDSYIPALVGSLYAASPAASKRKIPKYSGMNLQAYAEQIDSILNKAIRDMTQWRRKDFNIPGADMSDSKSDLVLVSFDNPIDNAESTVLDLISSRLRIGPTARAAALGESLGVEVYEMPSPGIITSSVARAYRFAALPGMQTADTLNGTHTKPYPKLRFALIGRGALNVGLKRLRSDSSRSARGHFDQTWIMPTLELAYGAGQAIFFEDGEETVDDGE